jgi:hypothetical protein
VSGILNMIDIYIYVIFCVIQIDRYVIGTVGQVRNKFNTNDSYPEWKLNDLKANTEYRISIKAMNRQGAGLEGTVTFRTNATCKYPCKIYSVKTSIKKLPTCDVV